MSGINAPQKRQNNRESRGFAKVRAENRYL